MSLRMQSISSFPNRSVKLLKDFLCCRIVFHHRIFFLIGPTVVLYTLQTQKLRVPIQLCDLCLYLIFLVRSAERAGALSY